MKEKHILQVASSYLHLGGVEYQIHALSQELSGRYQIHLAADVSNEFYEKYIQTGGTHTGWKVGSRLDLAAIISFNKIINSIKPDLVHIHDPRAGLLLRPLLRLKRIPVVYTPHLPPYVYVWSGRFSKLRQTIYGKTEQVLNLFFTSAVIYISSSAYGYALEKRYVSPARAHLILNGINLEPYRTLPLAEAQQLRSDCNISPETPILCSVARLSLEKNFPFFLKAVSQLHMDGYKFAVWIVGSGPDQDFLIQLARELGLESVVKFWGGQANVPLFLSAGSIFVLTSLYEGRTVSVMEAQAAGKPCVVSAAGDHALLVENGRMGFVFENGDQDAIVNRLKQLLDSPELVRSFGEAARQKAFHEYDIRTAASQHIQVYESVLREWGSD